MDQGSRNLQIHHFPLLPPYIRYSSDCGRNRHIHCLEDAPHKNVTTTQIYADLVSSKKRETVGRIKLK